MELKNVSTRDLLIGIFSNLPKGEEVHADDIISYIMENFDVSTTEINENLGILCGNYLGPRMLERKGDYYTLISEQKIDIKDHIERSFDEKQFETLEKLTKGLLKYREI